MVGFQHKILRIFTEVFLSLHNTIQYLRILLILKKVIGINFPVWEHRISEYNTRQYLHARSEGKYAHTIIQNDNFYVRVHMLYLDKKVSLLKCQ